MRTTIAGVKETGERLVRNRTEEKEKKVVPAEGSNPKSIKTDAYARHKHHIYERKRAGGVGHKNRVTKARPPPENGEKALTKTKPEEKGEEKGEETGV